MHTQHYLDFNPPKAKNWPWVVGAVVVYALIGILLAWRG